MVKNIINIFIFFILCVTNMSFKTHAFLGEEAGLNLYNIIDEGYENISQQNFSYELSGADDTIKEKVNLLITQHYALSGKNVTDCIKGDLAPSHIKEIALGNTQMLFKKMGDNCKDDSNNVNIGTLNTVQKIIYKHYIETKDIAEEKSHQIQKIASLGIYSDGILENGSFDLIDDIEKIDSIIFSQKFRYEGEEHEDFNNYFEEEQKNKINMFNSKTSDFVVINENNGEAITTAINQWNTNNIDLNILKNFHGGNSYYGASSNYVCVEGGDHGFNPDIIDQLLNPDQNNGSPSNAEPNNDGSIVLDDELDDSENDVGDSLKRKTHESISGNYEKLNDNAYWPCSNFFCITVDFVVNQQQLLGGGENITIEYLIDRSNQHLRKFANASLAPAKMTTQNFEMGLMGLNLSEMFHMSFQVSSKPVPILDVNQNDRSESNENSSNTLLEKYYKANSLDYNRRNDITIFLGTQSEYKTLLNSTELDKRVVVKKLETLNSHKKLLTLKSKQISDNIYKKVTYETLGDFGTQFIELNSFTSQIRQHTQQLSDLVDAMIKIPIDG